MPIQHAEDVFESGCCDHIDVTSLSRPDPSWRFTDAQGHEHRWHVEGRPATDYSPTKKYDVPTVEWIKTGEAMWEDDDEPHDVGAYFCKQCGEEVTRGFRPDDHQQLIPGSRWFTINGQSVTGDEFKARVIAAGLYS